MDKISIVAILMGLTAIIAGQALEGGNIGSLMQLTAFMIVIGGTVSAVMLQSTPKQFAAGVRMLKWIFQPPVLDHDKMIREVINWSQTARKGGLLALEGYINLQKDPFIKKALQMLVDGAEPDTLRSVMDVEISMFEHARKQAARIWESAGGYAPTMGILGAVLGLIHVMENLSDPSKLGAGIAVAFVATVYGVGSANLLFLPIANKLKHLIASEVALKELVVEGLVSIANGENPRIIESRLKGFLAMHE
ncbi:MULTISPECIES: flagellar motor protein [Chromobacterium]|uniref:Flagellar motor protein n=1 Tax=Chromobacterium fluminis TaxID=3044269 RepID=A0ABX0LAS5_9NEIS|nr:MULTISPECIES: flagellar motor protein [Chromobacterium]MCP1290820.1 flagellar motor protein [Chromobacterium sp. S0633]NHR06298.1 flagellar motor protein [Chromobacterium haemolyticum]OQS42149.1 flagellar motor protein [Chromobacterium haemolyticum]PTU66346.1 flagellar motor protein [Chromobacterium sp. Panama]UJB33926.1 flagellar motor protein [Chromobacterium sp. Beijing]